MTGPDQATGVDSATDKFELRTLKNDSRRLLAERRPIVCVGTRADKGTGVGGATFFG